MQFKNLLFKNHYIQNHFLKKVLTIVRDSQDVQMMSVFQYMLSTNNTNAKKEDASNRWDCSMRESSGANNAGSASVPGVQVLPTVEVQTMLLLMLSKLRLTWILLQTIVVVTLNRIVFSPGLGVVADAWYEQVSSSSSLRLGLAILGIAVYTQFGDVV